MSGRDGAALGWVRVSVGRSFLDAGVMTIGPKRISFFADFSHQTPMECPGATRGGKRKPFLEAGG